MRFAALLLWAGTALLPAQTASDFDSLMATSREALKAHDYSSALDAAQKAAVAAPNRYEPHYYLGIIYHRQKLDAPAAQELNTALQLAPDDQKLAIQEILGQLQADSQQSEFVIKAQEAEQAGRTMAAAHYYENAWVKRQSDEKSALAAADDYATSGVDPVAAVSLWKVLADGMDTTDATRNICRQKLQNYYQDQNPNSTLTDAIQKAIDLARGEFFKGNFADAEWRYIHLTRVDDNDPEPSVALARIYASQNNVTGAIKYLVAAKKIVGQSQDNPAAWYYAAEFAIIRNDPDFKTFLANNYTDDVVTQIQNFLRGAASTVEKIKAFCADGPVKIVPDYSSRGWADEANSKSKMSDREGDLTIEATPQGFRVTGSQKFTENTGPYIDPCRYLHNLTFPGYGAGLIQPCDWRFDELFEGNISRKDGGSVYYVSLGINDNDLIFFVSDGPSLFLNPANAGYAYYFKKD